MKKFVCKARLIKKEGYTGIFVTRKGMRFKLPYKDLQIGEIGEVYYLENNKKNGRFSIFQPKRIKGISLSKRRDD